MGHKTKYALVLNFDDPSIRRVVCNWLLDGGGEDAMNQGIAEYNVDLTMDGAHVVPQYGWESVMPATINVTSEERDDPAQVLALLREQFGVNFDSIEDVDAWVKQHRKGME